jgi:hypothetical protein
LLLKQGGEKVKFYSMLFLTTLFFSIFGCKTTDDQEIVSDELGLAKSRELEEFSKLDLNVEIAYLGSVNKDKPNLEFMTKEQISTLYSELWKAFSGSSKELKFLYCEARAIYPETTDNSACSYVLKLSSANIQFSFISYNIKLGKKCMLVEEGCKIHQITTIRDPSKDGLQRPPVFLTKSPVPEKVLLWTNHVVVPSNKGLLGYLEKFVEKDVFAPLFITPYNISKPFGMELGKLFGSCNKQVMNLVDFSNRAIKHYHDHRRSVVLTSIAANSAIQAATLVIASGSVSKFTTTMSKFSGPAGATVSRTLLNNKLIATTNLIGDIGGVPSTLVSLVGVKRNMELMKPGSVERKASQLALYIGQLGTISGLATPVAIAGELSAPHWKAAATALTMIALVGGSAPCKVKGESNCDARAFIKANEVKELIERLRSGNTTQVASSLCHMQKKAGLRKDCPPPPPEPIVSC